VSGIGPLLSIVVPAFNEADRIGSSLERVSTWIEKTGVAAEVVVVDDGSSDGTAQLVDGMGLAGVRAIRGEKNRGKGAALRLGVAASRGDSVLISDADFSTPIEEVERLQPALRDADLVLGSRATEQSRITRRQSLLRETAGRTFNLAVRLSGVRGIRDTQCGFKLLRGEVARRLFAALTVDRYAYDVELIWLAQRLGYRVIEVGVEWRNDPASRVHVLRDGLHMLLDLVRFRLRHHRVAP